MCLKLIIIVLFVIVSGSNNIKQNLARENINLYQSLALIINEKFIEVNTVVYFYVNFNNSYYANDFINAFLHDFNASYKIFYQRKKVFYNLKHNEVILFDNLESFRYFYQDFYTVGNINLSRTLMFILSITTLDFETLSVVFKDLFHMGIIKLALVVQLAPDNIIMLTYFPFTPTSCHDLTPVIINHYLPEQKRWSNLEYFPTKLKDFYGCPLTCCAWDNMPYFSIKHAKNGSIIDYKGLEAETLKFIGRNKNFTIKIHLMDKKVPKQIYNEGSIFAKVFSETCDFALGGFAYKKDLNYTSPFSQTNYFFLSNVHFVTNKLNFYSTYEKIAFPFNYIVWYLLGFILAMSCLLIYTSGRRPQWKRYQIFLIGPANTTPYFNLYAIAVGANLTNANIPKRNFSRFLLACWILATLVLRSAYQSGMYQMLRDNKQRNPPQTIENVFKQNYLISMTPENRRYLPILPEVKRMRIFNTTILPAFPELLKATEPTAFIAPYEYFGYFGKVNTTQWRRLHIVSERLVQQQLTFYIRHHSYLIHEFNDEIARAQYYGFYTLWNRQYIEQATGGARVIDDDVESPKSTNVLSMHELGAIFMILIWSHFICIAIFLMELAWHKYKNNLSLESISW